MKLVLAIVSLWTFMPMIVNGQSTLSIREIMTGEDFVGYLPEQIYWSDDSRHIYFTWNPAEDTLRSLYRTDTKASDPEKLTIDELKSLCPRDYRFNKNKTLSVYEKDGDLFLHDLRTGTTIQITHTIERESDPQFTQDELLILYKRGHNIFSWAIDGGSIRQLTNFREGKKPDQDKPKSEQEKWFERDQMELFGILRKEKQLKELNEKRSNLLKPDRPLAIYTGSKNIISLEAGPQGRFFFYTLMQQPSDNNATKVPEFVTETGYLNQLNARSKVGSPQSTFESWIYDRKVDTTYRIVVDSLPGIKDKPLFLQDYIHPDSTWNLEYDRPREVNITAPVFSDEGLLAVAVVRSQDNKDRWILLLDMETGSWEILDRQRDEAWIGGPGISNYNFSIGNVGWLVDGQKVWFQSEETGYAHLYVVDINTKEIMALTHGDYEVQDVILSHDKTTFYITTNEIHPGEKNFYQMNVDGSNKERITEEAGAHEVLMSPDEEYLAIRYSTSNQPWELYMMKNKPGARMKQVTESTTNRFKDYSWSTPEIIQFEARDSAMVYARLYQPEEDVKNGAAVIFVHGAGYLQNAHKWWSSYYREYMFHNFLTDRGYTVLDIDYRGSAGYGRDWRTGIYRHMGGKDLTDQVDGARYLVNNYGIDRARIGIYGGSYGGFITLMALFLEPETFACGAALRSVTDWAHYNHAYTSNILNTPVEDSIAYRRSSPIYHAEGLDDPLVMLHGMVDTNVQFQDVVRLSQRLIELGKENWELAVFPIEGHGFDEAFSWADEYRRIHELFQEYLER